MWKVLFAFSIGIASIADAAQAQQNSAPAVDMQFISRVAARFKQTFQTGGIAGIANDIQNCYARTSVPALADCIALDGAGKYLDDMHIKMMRSRGAKAAQYPFFEDNAWNERIVLEGRIEFGMDSATVSFLEKTEKPIADYAMR